MFVSLKGIRYNPFFAQSIAIFPKENVVYLGASGYSYWFFLGKYPLLMLSNHKKCVSIYVMPQCLFDLLCDDARL